MLFCRTEERGLIDDKRSGPSSAACSERSTPIDEDSKQPRAEPLRILTSCQRPVGAYERVLQRFLRVLSIAKHVERVARVSVAIPLDQQTERLHISAQHAGNDYGIRGASFQEDRPREMGESHMHVPPMTR
jgi:hypothetical protein